jgi:hypothetical protein
MNKQCAAANQRLAGLLGWTELFVAGSALLGRPPSGAPNSRGQAAVPDWCGCWEACGPLMVEHRCFPSLGLLDRGMVYVLRDGQPLGHLVVNEFPSHEHAVRTAIVYSVIRHLTRRVAANDRQGSGAAACQ